MNKEEALLLLKQEGTKAALAAIKFLDDLDSIIDVYVSPSGKIAVNGIYRNRTIYRAFQNY